MTSAHVIGSPTLRKVMAKALYFTLATFAFVFIVIVTWGIHPWGQVPPVSQSSLNVAQ